MKSNNQLLSIIAQSYASEATEISNEDLYKVVAEAVGAVDELSEKKKVGNSVFNEFKRKVRWFQQTLKESGVIEKVEGKRGVWCLSKKKAADLDKILPTISLIGFSTKLGVAIIGYSENVFSKINEPVHLVLTSPPYPLTNPRKYGNVKESEYVDWICKTLEPVIKNLADGGSLVLNISNDCFIQGSPARSLYRERLIIALNDRFGLYKMDEIIWHNSSKPPGPYQWASKKRYQLNVGYEPILWLCNNPEKTFADNRRVLEPHSEKHMAFMLNGGSKISAVKSDGSYRLKVGSYGNVTAGRIPKNVLSVGTNDAKNRAYKQYALSKGLVAHGAMMPGRIASFLIRFLTEQGQLVVDNFAGSLTTGYEAEMNNRRWICVDPVVDYVMGGSSRFFNCDGFEMNGYIN